MVLPADMDRAMDRIREGFVAVTTGDPLAVLADDLGVAATEHKRLPQGEQSLEGIYRSATCLINDIYCAAVSYSDIVPYLIGMYP